MLISHYQVELEILNLEGNKIIKINGHKVNKHSALD
jgi:hypothetical protein